MKTCPNCQQEVYEVFFGDEAKRWRCIQCEALYTEVKRTESDPKMVDIGGDF